jgi:hypothetical protein
MAQFDIARQRLHNQLIASPTLTTPAAVVDRLVAIQAQDYNQALWAIGLRLPAATQAAVEQAIADKEIVRTWPMRGTLHFVTAVDIRWLLALLTPRILARSAGRHKQLELDKATFVRAETLFVSNLENGRQLTRSQMMDVLEKGAITTTGQRGYHILWWAAQMRLICFGPRQGKEDTFVLLDEWLPGSKWLDRDQSLAELTRRYFNGHGPATVQDFLWWSGLTAADARQGLEMVEAQLAQAHLDGRTYWFSPAPPPVIAAPSTAHLLPAFDQYLLGYRERDVVLNPAWATRIAPGRNGVFKPIIVIEGRVVGIWKRTLRKTKVVITVESFVPLSQSNMRDVSTAAERYGRFLQLPVELSFRN